MKVSREQMALTRLRLLEIASRRFREHGFDGVSVADLMKEAGLTHGAFYGHFASKEALAAEAASHALMQTADRWKAMQKNEGVAGLERIVDAYLSPRHLHSPGIGCAVAALGSELSRQAEPVRTAFGTELDKLIDVLSGFFPGVDARERRRRALLLMAQMLGAIVLARACGGSALATEVLETVHEAAGTVGSHSPATRSGYRHEQS